MSTAIPSRSSHSWQVAPADFAAARVRATTRKCLEGWGVENSVTDDAVLVADELYVNALQHADTPPGEEITVHLTLHGLALTIAVTDGDRRVPSPREPSDEAESGRGLLLVDALSVAWGTEKCPSGKRVWAMLPALPKA